AGLISGTELSKIFAGFVSLAVAAVPEGLTAVVTVVLALGVARMIKKKSIIRRLSAIETLGSASVVCTDKTGTLTQNKMTVVKLWTGDELIDAEDEWTLDAELLITYAALCSDASVTLREDGSRSETGDPTERAIIGAALEKDIDRNILMTRYPRLYEIPFDSERKLMTSVHRIKDRNLAIVKGAPDVLVSRCGNADREAVFDCNDGMAKNALRVIAVAYKFLDDDFSSVSNDRIESGLTFMGLIGLIDPPRPEALKAIKQCESAGIRPIMITGDHVVTASAIARQLGILTDDTRSITGAQLAKISDEEFENTVQNYSVYARVTPHDKLRIVKAWQKKGEVVAMTGDGVNDAPALKAADIGCAMGKSGTDVAKGAADIVISDDNFSTIVAAVREGRGLYENIKKSVHFLLSCNLGELLCIFLSMLIYGLSPLRSVHLLFINLLVCGLPALTLGMEPLEKDVMRRAPRSKNETVFADGTGVGVAWQGALLGILTIIAYAVGRGASPEAGRAMAFAVLSFGQLFHAFSLRSRKPVIRIGLLSNRLLIGALGISALLTLLVLLVPPFASLFSLAALSGNLWLAAVLLSAAPLVIGETVKVVVPLINKKLQKTLESDF
ncbi:MAG: cation-translocating P-type ATPase, partial [Clostridia bacterium]|nr:cation-translocating P-type ATPase [Clostridia bacterium]